MPIRKIDKNIGTVPVWGEDNFDANVHENFSSLKEIVPQVNNSIDDMNVVIEDLNSKIGTVDDSVVATSQAKTDAVAAAEAAIFAKNEAQAIYDNFDDRYLGPFLTPPTLDNDDQPLKNGALYYLYTESPEDKGNMYIYDLQRAEWIDISYIPTLFSSLTDVLLAGLETGDILKYNKALGKWQNIPRDYYDKSELDAKLDLKANTTNVYNKTELDNKFSTYQPFPIAYTMMADIIYDFTLVEFGGEFSRTLYPKLWAFIESHPELLKTEAQWQTQNTVNGMCGFFSSGNGTTTFRVRNMEGAFERATNRGVGTYEADSFKSHTHAFGLDVTSGYNYNHITSSGGDGNANNGSLTTNTTGGTETRPKNLAKLPLIVYK